MKIKAISIVETIKKSSSKEMNFRDKVYLYMKLGIEQYRCGIHLVPLRQTIIIYNNYRIIRHEQRIQGYG